MRSYSDLYRLIKQTVDAELGRSSTGTQVSSGLQFSSAEQGALESVSNAVDAVITQGLVVSATIPPSMSVSITAGYGFARGKRVELSENKSMALPIGEAVWYVLLGAGISISKIPEGTGLILAKIIMPAGALRIVQNIDLAEGPDGYIVSGTYVYGSQKYDPSDPAFKEAVASAIPNIFAENIFGTLKLSENLKITNTLGTMEAKSDGIRFKDTEGRILAEYLSSRARVGGWEIQPGLLKSSNNTIVLDSATSKIKVGASQGILIDGPNESVGTSNFVSGALGQGWRITPQEAEFQNARIRGVLSTSVFKKDTISASNAINIWSNSTVLKADLTSADSTTITVEDPVFGSGDRVRLKDGFNDEWILISSAASANGSYWNYTVTRDYNNGYSAGNNPAWKIGTAIVSFGNWNGSSGTGFLMADAASTDSPYLDILLRTGANPSQYTTKARLGNLGGITDPDFGALSGYGLYTDNAYIKGNIWVSGGNATITYRQASAPTSGMKTGDIWYQTTTYNLYRYSGTAWELIGNAFDNSSQLTDGAGWSTTALWTGVSGTGKPADNATKNVIYRQDTEPTGAIGDLWFRTDTGVIYRHNGTGWEYNNFQSTGAVTVGTALTGTRVIMGSSGLQAFNAATETFRLSSANGSFIFGDVAKVNKYVEFNPATGALTLKGELLITGGSGLSALSDANADSIAESATKKWAGETGANVTETRTAAAIAGQGALATLNSANWQTQVGGTGKPVDNATANLPDATLLGRANHTGTQGASSLDTTVISGGKIITGLLTASNIQTGTLDASVVNVTNLNANNITAGGTITGNTIRTSAGNERIELSASTKEMRWYNSSGIVISSIGVESGTDWNYHYFNYTPPITPTIFYGHLTALSAVNRTTSGKETWGHYVDVYEVKSNCKGVAVYGIASNAVGASGTLTVGGVFAGSDCDLILGGLSTGTRYDGDRIQENSVYRKIAYGIIGEVQGRSTNGTCTILKGSGFTCYRNTGAIYNVSFTTAFSVAPVVTAIAEDPGSNVYAVNVNNVTASGCDIHFASSVDKDFGISILLPS